MLVAMIAGGMATTVATIVVAANTFAGGVRRGLGLSVRRWPWDVIRGVIGFLAVFPLCFGAAKVMSLLIESGLLPIPPTPHPLLLFLDTASLGWKVLIVFGAVVMAPLSEELLYRGLLQSLLRRWLSRPWSAILVTSAVFAVVHSSLYKDWPALFMLSVVLGYNYERTGRLVAPIVIHALFNAAMITIALTS